MVKKIKGAVLLCFTLCLLLAMEGGGRAVRQALGAADVPEEGDTALIALTFDDGPRKNTTGPLLEGLALREVPATFFLVGDRIQENEDLVKSMREQGHQVGVHTFDHVLVTELSHQDFDLQVGRTRDLLENILGPGEYWLRPPYGIVDESVARWEDGPLVLWSIDPEDWKDQNADRIVGAVVNHAKDGDIILMHDIYPSSVEAALRIVDCLLERGYCFVTVEQLMELRGVEPVAGERYTALPLEEKEN